MEETIKEILLEFFDEKEVLRRLPKHLKLTGNGFTIAKLLKKFDKDGAKLAYKAKLDNDRRKGTLPGYIDRYGEVDGPIKYKEKNSRLSVSTTALRLNGKSDSEIESIQKKHSANSAITKENLIQRYGIVAGSLLHNDWIRTSKLRSVRCVDYWLSKGFNEAAAKIEVSKVQSRDLQFFINAGWTLDDYNDLNARKTFGWSLEGYVKKYGKEEGPNRWLIDKKKGSDVNWFILKYGEELGVIEYLRILKARTKGGARNSKIQAKFATAIFDLLPIKLKDVFWGHPISKDFWINFDINEYGIKCCVPDIRIHNILIEFDGDYWHSREDTIIRDLQKTKLLNKLGYLVYRVKEYQYKTDEQKCLSDTLGFIEKNINIQFKQTFKGQNNENNENNKRK